MSRHGEKRIRSSPGETIIAGGPRELAPVQQPLLDAYLETFDLLIGDQQTGCTLRGSVQGLIGAESLSCSRIAAFTPSVGHGQAAMAPNGCGGWRDAPALRLGRRPVEGATAGPGGGATGGPGGDWGDCGSVRAAQA